MSNHLFFGLNQTSYYPGKDLDGVILLHLQSPIKVKKIGVECEGNEFVSWWQGVSQGDHCIAKKQIFKESVIVFEEEEEVLFEPGTYAYNFATPLPQNIPLNFEEANKFGGTFGNVFLPDDEYMPKSLDSEGSYIRYTALAFADVVGEDQEGNKVLLKLSKSSNFKVVEQFEPELLSLPPIEKEIIEKPFVFIGDPIRVKAIIANGGNLFAGQKLYININIDNRSNKGVDRIAMYLYQIVTYTAPDQEGTMQHMKRRVPSLNAFLEQSQVGSKSTFDRDVVLPIPHNIPGSIRFGEHVHRFYELQIDVEMVPVVTLSIKVPITILEWSPLLKDLMPEVVNINIGQAKNPDGTQNPLVEENPFDEGSKESSENI